MLPNESGDGHIPGTVLKQARDNMGQPRGTKTENIHADTRMYVIKMHDGSKRELQHNIIAQNLYSQCDSEGRQYQLIDEICDICRNNKAVKKSDPDAVIYSKNGNQHLKRTTKGWDILATWKDQSQDWVPIK